MNIRIGATIALILSTIMVTILTLDFISGARWYIAHLMFYVTIVLAMVGSFLTLLWSEYD